MGIDTHVIHDVSMQYCKLTHILPTRSKVCCYARIPALPHSKHNDCVKCKRSEIALRYFYAQATCYVSCDRHPLTKKSRYTVCNFRSCPCKIHSLPSGPHGVLQVCPLSSVTHCYEHISPAQQDRSDMSALHVT